MKRNLGRVLNLSIENPKVYQGRDRDGNTIYPIILLITNPDGNNKLVELEATIIYIDHNFVRDGELDRIPIDNKLELNWWNGKTKRELMPEDDFGLRVRGS